MTFLQDLQEIHMIQLPVEHLTFLGECVQVMRLSERELKRTFIIT